MSTDMSGPGGVRRRAALGRWVALGLALSLVVTALNACGSSGSDGSPAGTPASSLPGASTTALTSELPAGKGPVDRLSWALPQGEPTTLDPGLNYLYSGLFVTANMCDKLLRQNPDFTVSPNLTDYKQVDPLTATLTLQHDAKFWDGKPVTSKDVAYSLTRQWKDPNFAGNFVFPNVKAIDAVDSKTVRVEFKKPDALFRGEMSGGAGAVIEKAFAEKAGKKLGTPKVGVMCSGPFMFKSWQPGDSITLVKNPNYWDPNARPRANTVDFSFVTNTSALVQGLEGGRFDGAYEVPPSAIPSLKASSGGRLTFGSSNSALGMWVANPGGRTANLNLRKAIMTAIDRKEIAAGAFNGAATPNYTFLVPAVWGQGAGKKIYEQAYAKWARENAYDPAKAKEALKNSGYSGETLKLATLGGDTTQATSAQIIQQRLAAIGVKLAITPLQAAAYGAATSDPKSRRGYDFIFNPNYYFYPNPLENQGTMITPGSIYNYTNFDNKRASANYANATQTLDPVKQAQLVTKVQDDFEPSYASNSLVLQDEVSFLSNKLTGGITSWAYLFNPSLAYIGKK